jgi:RNA-directed DNA polymerase
MYQPENREEYMKSSKPYELSKHLFVEAFKRVRRNKGAPGVDGQTVEMYESNLKDNLYKLWNRMSSGSYFPQAVRLCEIPKQDGGKRILGIPTINDRVAQMVAKLVLEPRLEKIFHNDSYGYRPGRSAHDAIAVTRQRCFKSDWVIDMDIKGFFDNIDHELMMKAVEHHADEQWIHLYVERWLKMSAQDEEGHMLERTRGTPQGGVISPLLANLFLHYAFDSWMSRTFDNLPFARYADDCIVHCRTLNQAEFVLSKIADRLRECGLELNLQKTKIVYCKDARRKGRSEHEKFDFLGYEFRTRGVRSSKTGKRFMGFTPAMSPKAAKAVRQKIRNWKLKRWVFISIEEIAAWVNPMIRGWLYYYGKFNTSACWTLKLYLDSKLLAWAMQKFKTMRRRGVRAIKWLEELKMQKPQLFAHWS